MKTSFVRARIEPTLKTEAEHILATLGISPSQAVIMLYKRITRDHEWPLELKVPTVETQRVLEETDKGIGLINCKDVDDLFEQIGIK